MLPVLTAVIVSAGIVVNSRITANASARLERVERVQYPTLEAMRNARADVKRIQAMLQQAVAEGDDAALQAVSGQADELRSSLRTMGAVDPANEASAAKLGDAFNAYYGAAMAATSVMLGKSTGDTTSAVAAMQRETQALEVLLDNGNKNALADFSEVLKAASDDVQRTVTVSIISAILMLMFLGGASWVLIGNVFGALGGEPEVAARIVRRIADGDFTTVIELDRNDSNSLLAGIETLRRKLGTLIQDVRATSGTVDSAANELNAGILQLSDRTSLQAANLETTAQNMEVVTTTVRRTADNARHANELAVQAREQAEIGGQVVSRAVAAMTEINASSTKIGDIIGVIDEIAFQTNLLALNAAVEAARAGEHGRGFAVVAVEVRNLSQRSATAAREIKELIADSLNKVRDGGKLVNESGQRLNDIVAAAKKVADIIGEISTASQQQAGGVDEVTRSIKQMDSMTQQNAAMVEETSSVATSMSEQASALNNLISLFKVEGVAEPVAPRAAVIPLRQAQAQPAAAPTQVKRPAVKRAASGDSWQEF